jgi:hypothetical protein
MCAAGLTAILLSIASVVPAKLLSSYPMDPSIARHYGCQLPPVIAYGPTARVDG